MLTHLVGFDKVLCGGSWFVDTYSDENVYAF